MSESKLVATHFSPAQIALIDQASKAVGGTKASFLRTAIGRAVSAQLGTDWPADEPSTGPQDAIAKAAEQYGMTRAQFVKYASLVAAGVPAETAKEKALKPHPLSKKAKAEAAAAAAATPGVPAPPAAG